MRKGGEKRIGLDETITKVFVVDTYLKVYKPLVVMIRHTIIWSNVVITHHQDILFEKKINGSNVAEEEVLKDRSENAQIVGY